MPGFDCIMLGSFILKHKQDNTAQQNATLIYASSRCEPAALEMELVKPTCSHCKHESLYITKGLWTDTRVVRVGISALLGFWWVFPGFLDEPVGKSQPPFAVSSSWAIYRRVVYAAETRR